METLMDSEAKLKRILYIILFIVAVLLAMHCSDIRLLHISRLITNYGHSDRLHWARIYFLIFMGIGAIIIQNVFIRKAIKRIEENKDNQERKA